MQSDADRFRPHRGGNGHLAEQSPPQPSPAQQAPAQQPPRYAAPQYAPPLQYGPPHAQPGFDIHGAQLIHPAAAQASNITPYGVPVYRTPAYALMPQPAKGLSITAFVLGLCSFTFAWIFVVVPIIGIVFGFLALRREPAGRTFAVIGLVASGLGLLWVLLFYLLPFLAFFGALIWTM